MKRCVWILFYVVLFLLIFAYSTTTLNLDFDLWARLIAGMGVIDGHQVLKADFLSYTPTHVWYDHEWGSGVVFYLFVKLFGPYSLIFLQAILVFLIFFIVSRIVKLKSENPYNILFYLFGFFAMISNLNQPVRCHLFSFVFFALFIYLFEKIRLGKPKLLFLVPILIVIWNNLHGGVVSGIGLILMYAVGIFLNGGDENKKLSIKFLITFFVSSICLIINPWGIDYIKFLLSANTMARLDIIEWWGLFAKFNMFKFFTFKIFLFFIVALEFVFIYKLIKKTSLKEVWKDSDKVKYIVLFATAYLAIKHTKLIPIFGISALSFCYNDFYLMISNMKFPEYKNRVVYGLLLFVSLFSIVMKDFSLPLDYSVYPLKEVEFIKLNKLSGNLLANFGIGSYISYKLYPQNKIYMDGRYEEVYDDFCLENIKNFHVLKPGWDKALTEFPPDVIIVEKAYPIYTILLRKKAWSKVFEGKVYSVFVKASDLKQKYLMPSDDLKYYKDTLFDTDIKF